MAPSSGAGPVVVIGVMDEDSWTANTDNLAVVDPDRRCITSVPRDLWSHEVGDRINRAVAVGGPALLQRALAEHGLPVDEVLVLRRGAVERLLATAEVTVPVDEPLAFLYPAGPGWWVEDGAVLVRFEPPSETLRGIRIHQWIGARKLPQGTGSDLHRIRRQHVLVRELLRSGFDLRPVLDDPTRAWVSSPAALHTMAAVHADWTFAVLDDVLPRRVGGKDVLVRRTPSAQVRHLGKRGLGVVRRSLGGWVARVRVPTGGWRDPSRRQRLIAVIAARDEATHLPGWLENVAPQVDGIVALDDGSTDGTADLLAAHPSVLEVLRNPPDRPVWDEVGNHRALVHAALRHGATWIVALDADERVERDFRARAERAIRRGRRVGLDAFALPMHELWDSPATWRSDGPWGRKRVARLFAARPDHAFDVRLLHAGKAPLQGKRFGGYVTADVRLYHLRMIDPADRAARRARYEELDPDRLWQPSGYAYLTDSVGCRLRRVPERRAPSQPATRPTA